jgi:hypothetical protein
LFALTKLDEWEIEMMAPSFGGPLAEWLANQIPIAATKKHRSYGRIPAEDFEQAIWESALRYAAKLKEYFDRGDTAAVFSSIYRAADKVIREDDRYVRAAKAAEAGYSIEDEEYYSTGLLGKVLPALIAADWDVADAMQRASSGTDAAGIHIHSSDPHSGAESYQAMLIDISTGFRRLTEGQRRLLRAYYGASQEDSADGRWERGQLANSMGLTESALQQRAHRALLALQRALGGPSPWRR